LLPALTGSDWEVRAAPAEHVQPFLDSLAYRVETPTGSIVFTGDTQPCESVIDLVRGADALVCMCWNDQDAMDADGEAGGQCGTTGAARMAQAAGVRRLTGSRWPRSTTTAPGSQRRRRPRSAARSMRGGGLIGTRRGESRSSRLSVDPRPREFFRGPISGS
jgi:hypothetical protein